MLTHPQVCSLILAVIDSKSAGATVASGDAFAKREKASEDKFMKDREREKMEKLKKHIAQQRKALDELEQSLHHDEVNQILVQIIANVR